MPDERMRRLFEELLRRADLHDFAVMHHHDRVGEREGFGLVVRHIEHRCVDFGGAPASVRPGCHLRWGSITVSGSSNSTAHTSSRTRPRPRETFCFMSAVRPLATRLSSPVRRVFCDDLHTRVDLPAWNAPIAQRESEVLGHRHRVVDDGN